MTKARLKEIIGDLVNELSDMYDRYLDNDDFGDYITDLVTKDEAKELDLDGWFGEDEDDEDDEDNDWDGCCPYCGSSDVDFVDEIDGEIKYICRDCNEDFLVDNATGCCTDRHRRPIRKEED